MTIMDHRCPRCGIRRTADLGNWGSFCFNCRLQWGSAVSADDAEVIHGACFKSQQHPFGPHELLRLKHYRAAIQAGFFTDWPVAQGGPALAATSACLKSGAMLRSWDQVALCTSPHTAGSSR